MKLSRSNRASVLVIVLWIAFGLVSLALYFGQSMLFNLKAADNYEASVEADQAIEGAARYVSLVLSNLQQQVSSQSTNMPGLVIQTGVLQAYTPTTGQTPYTQNYFAGEVPVGNAKFWFIGRDAGGTSNINSTTPVYGLVDEAAKLNLNTATLEMLEALPTMTADLAEAIINWRSSSTNATSGGTQLEYGMLNPPYRCKSAPFETIDELKLVIGATPEILNGADLNQNGILESNENGQITFDMNNNLDAGLNAGILEHVTVYTREPNTQPDGSARISVNGAQGALRTALGTALGDGRANQIMQNITATPRVYRSVLEFFIYSRMTADEFAKVADSLTIATGDYLVGLVNVNTASAPVLACLPGVGVNNAPALVAYRQAHPDQLATIAWVAQALDRNAAIQAGPYLTAKSYQFTVDVAAVGHHDRGYRRTVFVFDISDGKAQIIYRRDLNQRTWALGAPTQQPQFGGMM